MALWRKNLGGKYGQAGIDPADDDALAEQSMKDYDEQHDALKRYKDRDAKMDELFARQPQSAAMLMAMAGDGDKDTPASRLRNFFGDEICEMLLDKDVDDEALDKAFAERRENLKRIEEEDKKDKEAWRATLERWQKSHQELGLSVDETNAALGRMEDFVERFISGKLTDDDLQFFHKGGTYDQAVASTREEATIDGRNQRIDEGARRRKKEQGAQLPSLGGKSQGGAEGQPLRGGGKPMGNVGPGIWDA